MDTSTSVKEHIKKLALENDFQVFGISSLPDLKASHLQEKLEQFVTQGFHGDMHWLAHNTDIRSAAHKLWPEVKSVIMLAQTYYPDHNPLDSLNDKNKAVISVYAQRADYHDTIKKKLKTIARSIYKHYKEDVKVFVDTAPIMEKPLAASAGIGWQGKHTNLVSRQHGSWLFLGSIFTTLMLEPDPVHKDMCGSCTRCLDICPTQAFVAPYQIDARRCISYLTIEYKGIIDISLRKAMGNRIFGCDDCLAICPWNKFAHQSHALNSNLTTHKFSKDDLDLHTLIQFTEQQYRDFFRKTPVRRSGYKSFLRNILIAIGNSGDHKFISIIEVFITHCDYVVRATAIWAYAQLADRPTFIQSYKRYYHLETHEDCQKEWIAARNAQHAIASTSP